MREHLAGQPTYHVNKDEHGKQILLFVSVLSKLLRLD